MDRTRDEPDIFTILESKGLFRCQFEPFFMSRSQWADFLGCSRTTLFDYERKIIRLVFPVLVQYQKAEFLDAYQRFILALIYGQSQGWIDGKRKKHSEIKNWLKISHTHITREQFTNWID